ncbi:MAG: hypothetical protein D6761_06030 [Candidatus Dadabacteria bacterium]|nr:MAG: hypothetical protein D6761_06030 [Candidatus Dadabacteria bacterium]
MKIRHHAIPRALRRVQLSLAGLIAVAFPVAAACVFNAGVDRRAVADMLAAVYASGIWALLLVPGVVGKGQPHRLEWTVRAWVWLTSLTHLTWELGWLLLRDAIIASANSAWAYPWWAYIDGGDLRYGTTDPVLWVMELLSVCNGIVGLAGLWLWHRRPRQRREAVLLWMAQAVVHLYATSLYFGSEIVAGCPNVDTTRVFDVGVKFVLANAPWLVFPVAVLCWGRRVLRSQD